MAISPRPWRGNSSSRPGRKCCSAISLGSKDELIAAVAAKAVKEVTYHQELAGEWVIRLGDGTEESRRRMEDGLDWNWRFVPELFEMDDLARVHGRARHRRRPRRLPRRLRRADRAPSSPKRRSSRRPTSARSSAAAAATMRASRPPARGDAVPPPHLSGRDMVARRRACERDSVERASGSGA